MMSLGPLVILASVAVQPQAQCPVRVVPEDAPPAWVAAASDLARSLRDSAAADRDCREVVVHAAPDPSVEVITADGRRGVRRLADARDLEPTVTALIVTVPDESMSAPTLTVNAEPPVQAPWRLLLFAGGAGRLTLPSTRSLAVDLMVGTVRGPWELALYGSWVPKILGAAAPDAPAFSSAGELAVSVARRQRLRSVDLILGGRAGAIALWGHSPPARAGDMTGPGNVDLVVTAPPVVFAPALSAFVGTAVPILSSIRVRPQATLQWVPLGWTSAGSSPIWSVGVGLGAETGAP